MAIPEGHVEKVCLRHDTMCPRLVIFVDAVKKTRRFECMKGRESSTHFFEVMFADEPEIIQAMNDARPIGNCSGAPAYFEYPPED
ncbi:hypothetical protein K2P56_03615 [Patescibacteria group bacterium]|nr:hypothetical protein [Patescibacteria group bacterium]